MNLYTTEQDLFIDLCKERKVDEGKCFKELAVDNTIKAWFSVIESTGGAATPNKDSKHYEEKALYHLEEAIKILRHEI